MGEVDPIAIGKSVGNIVNGMPEYPTPDDIQVALDAARMGVLEQLESFDEVVVPEDDVWGIPGAEQ